MKVITSVNSKGEFGEGGALVDFDWDTIPYKQKLFHVRSLLSLNTSHQFIFSQEEASLLSSLCNKALLPTDSLFELHAYVPRPSSVTKSHKDCAKNIRLEIKTGYGKKYDGKEVGDVNRKDFLEVFSKSFLRKNNT